MKKLRFKAWNKDANRFSKPFGLQSTVLNFTDDDGLGVIKSLTSEVVVQFIGIRDKNEIDIYEGSIIKFFCESEGAEGVDSSGFHTYVVPYLEFHGMDLPMEWFKSFEIIGSIQETPELLSNG